MPVRNFILMSSRYDFVRPCQFVRWLLMVNKVKGIKKPLNKSSLFLTLAQDCKGLGLLPEKVLHQSVLADWITK